MKYIDADKLIAEINVRLMSVNLEKLGNFGSHRVWAYNDVKELIASLQQEHPEGLHFTPLNRLIQKIPSKNWNDTINNYAKKLRDCLIKEGYRKDAEVLQGYISYMNGNNVPMATMDEQEQKVVDLDVDSLREWSIRFAPDIRDAIEATAYHFWNLAINARKEE